MSTEVRWRKAPQSGAESNCVEVSHNLDAVRDSKNPTTTCLRGDVRRLLDAVTAGQINQ